MSRWRALKALTILLAWATVAAAYDEGWERCYGHGSPFGRSGAPEVHYGRGRPIDVKHIKLALTVDFEREMLSGTATHTVAPVGKPIDEIVFDSVGIDVAKVAAADGSALDFMVSEDQLTIYLPEPAEPDIDLSVAVHYSTKPARGLYFRTPRMGYEPIETQAWTQGESEDARSWFPCFDYPNERATTEVIATVPEKFMALSNGVLLDTSHNRQAKTKTYHWIESMPHVSYLVSLIVGQFVEIQEPYGDISLYAYVLPGFEKQAHLAFGKTADMMQFFSESIGVPYPYKRYSQVPVVDFVAGGMENTTIATLTERTLHDEAAHLTFSSDSLVAHELAHQWFGDLLTCRDWSHLWLNEGFGTYLQALYFEHDRGKDDFLDDMLTKMQRVLDADKGDQRAPIVRKKYGGPGDLFDSRSYQKGAWVLHMLRRRLGDDLFWKCIHEYCARYSHQVVETRDLLRTIEEVSGEGMERFFDQWVHHGGYPELNVSYSWDNGEKLAKVVVKQTQAVDDITPIFHFDTTLLFSGPGDDHLETVAISEKEQVFHVRLEERPEYVRFDPENDILKRLEFDKPKPMLLAQLASDPSVIGRYQAADKLAAFKSDDVVEALTETMRNDPFWGARARAAEALGKVDNEKALDALVAGLEADDARVRRAVVQALGTIDKTPAHNALIAVIGADESPYVADAITALGLLESEKAIKPITSALAMDSHAEVIRSAVFRALAEIGGEQSFRKIAPYLSSSKTRMAIPSAMAAVAELGRSMDDKDKPRKSLAEQLKHPRPMVRSAALNALVTLEDPKGIDDIQVLAHTTKDPQEKQRANDAIAKLHTARGQSAEVRKLRERIEELQEKDEELGERLKEIESLLKVSAEDDEEPDH